MIYMAYLGFTGPTTDGEARWCSHLSHAARGYGDQQRTQQRIRKTNVHGENTPPRQTVPYEDPAWDVVASGAASPEHALLRPPHNSAYQDNSFSILD